MLFQIASFLQIQQKTKSLHELGLLVESALITGRTGDTKEAERIYNSIIVDKLSRVDKFYYHKSYGTYLAERVRFNESLVELNKARMFADTERQTEDVKDQMASYKSLRALTGSK